MEKSKLVVFFAIPGPPGNEWEYYCDTGARGAKGASAWYLAAKGSSPDSSDSRACLVDKMKGRGATEHVLVIPASPPYPDWYVDYRTGYSREVSIEVGRQITEWRRTHPAYPAAAAPAPEPKKEEEITRCGFCEEAAEPLLLTCKAHHSVAVTHSDRLRSGGLVDCPETRAESVRFVARQCAEVASDKAALTGYRTPLDHLHQSLQEQKLAPAPGAIASAGSTPHYEWP